MNSSLERFEEYCKKQSNSLRWEFFNAASYRLEKLGLPVNSQPISLQMTRLKELKSKVHNLGKNKQDIWDIEPESLYPYEQKIIEILSPLDYSEDFKNLARTAIDQTTQSIIKTNWQDIENYDCKTLEEQERFLQHIHDTAVQYLKRNLKDFPNLAEQFTPFQLISLLKEMPDTPENRKGAAENKTLLTGGAHLVGKIEYFHGSDIKVSEAIAHILHETFHSFEHNLSRVYFENKNLIPKNLRNDAKLPYLTHTSTSRLTPYFAYLYKFQYSERAANEMSHIAYYHLEAEAKKRNVSDQIIGESRIWPIPYKVEEILPPHITNIQPA